jgi:hypothetical protein
MYSFRDKKVAQDLAAFSVDRHMLKPTNKINKRRLESENTRIVRVGFSSYDWSDNGKVVAGIGEGDDYEGGSGLDDFTSAEYYGKYLMDHFWCYELLFANEDSAADTPEGDTDHLKTSLAINTDYGVTNPTGHETNGNLGNRSKFIAHNCCVVPLYSGMIIQVHNIGGHWIYNGHHQIMAEVSTDTVSTKTWGNVTPHPYGIDESAGSTTFDFDTTQQSATAGKTIKAYNPWSEDVPANAVCMLGDVGGRLTIMGWEC